MNTEEVVIVIPDDGPMRFIYNEDMMQSLMAHGEARISRASHVEPGDPDKGQDPLKWYADMGPVSGPILGPFNTRKLALTEEIIWLQRDALCVSATPCRQ
jgi:hypothetical protein